MSLVDKRAIIDRKPKLSKPQHTLKCTEGTKHFQLLLDDRIFRQACIFNVTWRLTISSQKFQMCDKFLKIYCIKTLNKNQIICFSWGH